MDVLGAVALVLLTLVGYSSGSVLAGRRKRLVPGIVDLGVVGVLWIAVFAARGELGLGKWQAIGAGLLCGLVVGALFAALRPGNPDPRARLAHLDDEDAAPAPRPSLLDRWKEFAAEMGNFQGRMIMGFFYFLVVTPFALISKLGADGSAPRSGRTFWLERPPAPTGLDQARNQF